MSYPLAFLFLLLYLLMCQILPLKAEVRNVFLEHDQQVNSIKKLIFYKLSSNVSSQTKGNYEKNEKKDF